MKKQQRPNQPVRKLVSPGGEGRGGEERNGTVLLGAGHGAAGCEGRGEEEGTARACSTMLTD
jgi:hypothetical protein